jgi:hypothetical protein
LKDKLEEIFCVNYHEDGDGKFLLPLEDLMQKFGSKQEEQGIDQYLEIIKHGQGSLEIDALVSLSLQLHIGVQVLQKEANNDKYIIIFDIPPQKPGYATFVTLFTPSEVVGGIGHWSGVSYLSYHEVLLRHRMKSNQEVACMRRVIARQIFSSLEQREAALSAVKPRPFLPPLVILRAKTTGDVDPFLPEINSDAEDLLLVEALQQYKKFPVP